MTSTWDEDARLAEGHAVLRQVENLPAVLQLAPWLGRLLAAAILRQAGVTSGAHLAAINLGLNSIPVDRRRHRDRERSQGRFRARQKGRQRCGPLCEARLQRRAASPAGSGLSRGCGFATASNCRDSE
jgi:hypothetical protein